MSARQLKKLRGYDQTEDLKKMMGLASGDESEEEAPKLMKAPKKKNFGFASLVDDEEDNFSEEDEEETPTPTVQKTPTKKSKKKKNKKKKAAAQKKEDDFDSILAEFKVSENDRKSAESAEDSIVRKMTSCLRIDSKFLDPDAELKRIFGNAAVNADRADRKQQKGRQPQRKLRNGTTLSL